MPRTISLDKPLLEQQSVREMLTPLTEGIKKGVRMNDLLNIARAVIHFELADCGCDESELTGLKLSYAVMHPQDENVHRVYTIEWNLPQSEVAGETTETPPEVSTSSDSNPPISNQLMSKGVAVK